MLLFCQKVVRIGSLGLALSLLGQTGSSRTKSASAAQFVPPAPVTIDQQIISQDTFDQAHASADALRATVVADQAAVENARLQLAYCTVTSPSPPMEV